MTTPSINYVIAAYFGPRRVEYAPQVANRALFIERQLESLARLKHSIAQITIVMQTDGGETYWHLLSSIASAHGLGAKTQIIHRKNDLGLSYTALAEAIDPRCEYTIFNEDDYIFTRDYFDEYLVAKLCEMRDLNGTALLCGCERIYVDQLSHAAVSTSIARTEDLLDLPRAYDPGHIPQVAWSRHMLRKGPISDWLHDYATGYRLDDNGVRWIERTAHGQQDPFTLIPTFKRALSIPIQALDDVSQVHYWNGREYARRRASVNLDGTLGPWQGDETT